MNLTTDFQVKALFTIGEERGDRFSRVNSELDWHESNKNEQPTLEEIQTKADELKAEEPMRLLRLHRNYLLSETDWWATSDRTMTAEQTAYREELRDLPTTASPALSPKFSLSNAAVSEKNNPKRLSKQIANVTWPTKP